MLGRWPRRVDDYLIDGRRKSMAGEQNIKVFESCDGKGRKNVLDLQESGRRWRRENAR